VLLFTDGDCIPCPDVLEPHLRWTVRGRATTGDRCWLAPGETDALLGGGVAVDRIAAAARRRERGRLRALRWKNRLYSLTGLKPRPKLLTANASVHRGDFERVNGFDERFVGWGYEDEDLARRLRRVGVRIVDACLESLVLHLFHPVDESHRPNAREGQNYRYFHQDSYLTRPLLGLERRPATDLRLELLGEVPGPLGGLARPCLSGRPEVSVLLGGANPPTRPSGEVVVRVARDLPISSPDDLYRLLERCV
jgi:hypothetical protein